METLLRSVLGARPPAADTLAAWWSATEAPRAQFELPIDRALVGGAWADRLGFAFAGGYQEALRALVPASPERDALTALCVTETRGNKPRDIETTLVATGDHFEITGKKRWATAAPLAKHLLVAATIGLDAEGRNQVRLVRVPTEATGVTLAASAVPFVPEIPHAEVTLERVAVRAEDILPGDGYAEYVKPFRTIEDIHVHAALLGYLIGVARRHDFAPDLIEQLLGTSLAVRGLAQANPRSPVTHLPLAGTIAHAGQLVAELERAWEESPDDEWLRWQRDRPLLKVAGAARAARRDNAWSALDAR